VTPSAVQPLVLAAVIVVSIAGFLAFSLLYGA
jgi:hypothetical protein